MSYWLSSKALALIAGGDAGSAGSHHGDSQSQPQVQHSVTATGSVVRSEQIAAPALPVFATASIRRVWFYIAEFPFA